MPEPSWRLKKDVERHWNLLSEVPRGEPFCVHDVPAGSDDLSALSSLMLIECIEEKRGEPSTFRLSAPTRTYLAEYEPGWTLPCGHRGLRNTADVDGYQCQFEHCDAVFSRSQVETAMADRPVAADGGEQV